MFMATMSLEEKLRELLPPDKIDPGKVEKWSNEVKCNLSELQYQPNPV